MTSSIRYVNISKQFYILGLRFKKMLKEFLTINFS